MSFRPEVGDVPTYCEVTEPDDRLRLTRAAISPRSQRLLREYAPEFADIQRYPVPDDMVPWDVDYPDYDPPFIDQPVGSLTGKDRETMDLSVPSHVTSWESAVAYDDHGYPLNPAGRTGLRGRLTMNLWGPTPAADAVVVREGQEDWEVLTVVRGDNGLVAVPAGKLDPGETAVEAGERETWEETGLRFNFEYAKPLFSGVVDDDRGTDNAWFETTAFLVETEGDEARQVPTGADDAVDALWLPLDEAIRRPSHASTNLMLRLARQTLDV